MPERWQCGHCPLVMEIPDEQTNRPGYIDTILLIREHRFGHIADRLMATKTDEEIMALADEDLEPPGPTSPLWGEQDDKYGLPRRPVTSDDVGPAVDEAMAIVRRGP